MTAQHQLLLLVCSYTPTCCDPRERMCGSNNTRSYTGRCL